MGYQPLMANQNGRVHICAHRGHSVGAPENTIPALRAAAELGATVAEIDVVMTRDEHIILLHDEFLDRTTNGTGRAADLDLDAVEKLDAGSWFGAEFQGTRIPTLSQALGAARSAGMGLLVEIKERSRAASMADRLAALLEMEGANEDVLIISFDHVSLLRLHERFPALRTEIITHARHVEPAELARKAGAASVAVEWDMFHPDDAAALHAIGIGIRVTLPRPEVLARRQACGFDDLTRLAEFLAEGHIDVLAGDDVGFLARLVEGAHLP